MLDQLFATLFPASAVPAGPVEYVVAGLGNPGQEYAETRHNAGWLALETIAAGAGARVNRIRFKSLAGECALGGVRVLLLKPTTYMNLSGHAAQEALAFYKLPIERLVVLCDDVALPFGQLRVRRAGSDGGQKGLANIIYLTGSNAFARVRIGIGRPPHPDMDVKDWVLSRFSPAERAALEPVLGRAAQAAGLIVAGKCDEAMNLFNRTEKPETKASLDAPEC